MTQEADQPLIREQIRSDNVGPSMLHSPNRSLRWKARPHGTIRNFENEVRDLFQYVDGPHGRPRRRSAPTGGPRAPPDASVHRPRWPHRTAGLLPAHMWRPTRRRAMCVRSRTVLRTTRQRRQSPSGLTCNQPADAWAYSQQIGGDFVTSKFHYYSLFFSFVLFAFSKAKILSANDWWTF